jgi:NitT/TauT family transport system permease protein
MTGGGRALAGGRRPPIHAPRPPQADKMRRHWEWRRITHPLIALALFGGAWELFARQSDSLLIPSFGETLVSLVGLVISPALWYALAISNLALLLGFGLSLVTGIPLGFAIGRYRVLEGLVNPYLTIFLTVPIAGFIPLLLITLGIGLEARVAIVYMFAIVVLVANCRAGVRQVDPSLIEMARGFGASELQIWRRILLPASVPATMAGVRVSLGHAVTGMVVVELLLVAVGIGRLILELQSQFNASGVYASVVVVVVEAVLLISIAEWVGRRAAPWSRYAGA